MKSALLFIAALLFPLSMKAQLYTGLSGLLHVPSADMLPSGTARIGGYYLNRHFTPDAREAFSYAGEKYNTADFYLSFAPFSWIELGYTFTLLKALASAGDDKPKYSQKDRYFSIKLSPLREGRYWPSVAVGANDFLNTPTKTAKLMSGGSSEFFKNYYVAATKHFDVRGEVLSLSLAWRYWPNEDNRKWQGVVGGITYNPSFAPGLRVIAEYTGDDINVGAEYLLLHHLFLQVCLQNGKYLSAGLCYQTNLLGRE